jgi:hypothetical protein
MDKKQEQKKQSVLILDDDDETELPGNTDHSAVRLTPRQHGNEPHTKSERERAQAKAAAFKAQQQKKPIGQLNGSISIRSNRKAMNTSGSFNESVSR